ncbi:hypothetical protein [Hyphomicrobium sp. D-2]|uniref:hypothetical protein n=1 Tax=Hyphomicrobium sp. D-2 TaxID=3041621 RepID=UPI0024546CEC|nr:hypothetical protein [Hyphomicrobium sp. D-2]MDH4981363.1 hypothetical protein [Hyphomicrobium sp. D-2]
MGIDAERHQMIRSNAAFAIEEMGELAGVAFGFNEGSVAWVEGFIERQREVLQGDTSEGLVNVLGCYLGEALIAAVPDAAWDEEPQIGLGVRFANGDMVFPFAKVAKQLREGLAAGESVLSFYNVSIGYVATGQLGSADGSEAP